MTGKVIGHGSIDVEMRMIGEAGSGAEIVADCGLEGLLPIVEYSDKIQYRTQSGVRPGPIKA